MYKVFGIPIADVGLRGAVDLVQAATKLPGPQLVVTANPEILVYARKHPSYCSILQAASLVVPDGIGLVFSSYLSRSPIKQGRVTGVDLAELLVKESSEKGCSIYLVGSLSSTVLQKATQYFAYKYTKINIVGSNVGPKFLSRSTFPLISPENDQLLEDIKVKKPDILLVGFGHPKQELWLNYYLPRLPVKVGIGVGGSFDYFAGSVRRAPRLFGVMGLEWLWRLVSQPSRLERILIATFVFPLLVLEERLKGLFHVEQK